MNPIRILIFGSAAKGNMGPNSDIDVLIVMPEGIHRRQTVQFLYKHVRDIGVPFDMLHDTKHHHILFLMVLI